MTIRTLTQKELNKLNIYAITIVQDEEYAKDVVQDFILKMLESGKGDLEINCSYTYQGLRLLFLEEIYVQNANFRKRFHQEYIHFKSLEEQDDINEIESTNNNTQKKLDIITKTYDELNTFDRQLYYIHFTKGYSQREIARQTTIKLGVIKYRFKKIKELINKNYENSKQ